MKVDDLLLRITKAITKPHPLPDSERPTRLRTAVTILAPFGVIAVLVVILALIH